jgi:hypothetical protein
MSTKTTFKRVALVAVAALGLGTLAVAPATAANAYAASFTAPSSVVIQTAADGSAISRDIGTIQVNLSVAAADTFVVGTDTATVTISAQTASGGVDAAADTAQQAKNNALLARLTISSQSNAVAGAATTVAATASNDTNFATTGWNATNNATVSTTSTTMLTSPTSASFANSVGKAYLKMSALTAAQATAANGGVVVYNLTVAGGGRIQTFTQTISATIGLRTAGTATVPTATGTINAGGSATFTYTSPYTAVLANDAWTERTLTLGGTAAGSTFSATAVATGGAITLTRTDANNIVASAVKSNIAGAYSVTYTVVVNAAATAAAGSTITAAGFTVTVQPYTPAYNSSTLTPTVGTNGYRVSAADGGDGIAWALAADKTNSVLTVAIQQKDQNGNNISVSAYAKTVSAKITGKGSLTAVTNAAADAVVKEQAQTALNGLLTGNDDFTVYSDGTSGEGKLEISVDGAVVGTYTLRFLGDAAKVTATLLKPVGNNAGAVVGDVGAATTVDTTVAARTNTLAAASTTKDVGSLTDPAIAVSVLDANGWAIPTTAPIATSSNLAVISTATRLFIDGGVSNPAGLKYSAGTFVQHYSYTTLASKSGSTSDLTFTFVNTAGTALVSPAIKVAVGGALASATLTFDKTSYAPGAQAILTATGLDSSGNKAYDGQDVRANDFTSTLSFTAPTSIKLLDGTKAKTVNAPMASGTWTVTAYDVADRAYTATATITNVAAEAKAAGDAATAAAEAATDAASEATDAANAATDAANAAAEAADAATAAAQDSADAVAALSTQVSEMIEALKKQITALTNLVIKIQKKVKA